MDKESWLKKIEPFLTQKKDRLNSRKLNSSAAQNLLEEAQSRDFPWIKSLKELWVCVSESITSQPLCDCGAPKLFNRTYAATCGAKSCRAARNGAGWNKGLTKEDHPGIAAAGQAVSKRKKEKPLTEKEREVLDKMAEINRNRVYDPSQFEKARITNLEKYGVESVLSLPEVNQKGREAVFEKYGTWYQCSDAYCGVKNEIQRKLEQTNLKQYGFKRAIKNPEVEKKRVETVLSRYGVNSVAELPEVQEKRRITFAKKTMNRLKEAYSSLSEEEIFRKRESYYSLVWALTERSVAYFPWLVNPKNLDRNSKYHLDHKYSKSQGFINKVPPEVISHPANLEVLVARENQSKKDKCSISLEELLEKIATFEQDLTVPYFELDSAYSVEELVRDVTAILNNRSSYSSKLMSGSLINRFQPSFTVEIREKWKDPFFRKKLWINRWQHADTTNVTDRVFLLGGKKSGLIKGYSHFSPHWIRKFIQDHSVKSLYDPTGGWGHRLTGALDTYYIYNDLNTDTYEGVLKIEEFLKEEFAEYIAQHVFYNEDAAAFTPSENYEAVFTCPPYFNLEDYGLGKFESESAFIEWWKEVVHHAVKPSVRIFGVVIGSQYEKYIQSGFDDSWKCQERHLLGNRSSTHLRNSEKSDILLVYARN